MFSYINSARQGFKTNHYSDVTMGALASQITSLTIVYSIVYSDADQRKHQSSASLAFVRGIHRGPNSPHKWPVTRNMFPFDYVIMFQQKMSIASHFDLGKALPTKLWVSIASPGAYWILCNIMRHKQSGREIRVPNLLLFIIVVPMNLGMITTHYWGLPWEQFPMPRE